MRRSRSSSTASTSNSTSTSRRRRLAQSHAGELPPSIWYFAQLGLVEVAYQLRRVNHHLKVFVRRCARRPSCLLRQMTSICSSTAAAPSTCTTRRRACARSSPTISAARRTRNFVNPGASAAAVPIEGFPRPGATVDKRPSRSESRGRLRVHRPPHAAPPARLHDDRPEAVRPEPRRAPACRSGLKEVVNQVGSTRIASEYLNEIAALPRQRRPASRVLRRAARSERALARQEVRGTSSTHTTPRPRRSDDPRAHLLHALPLGPPRPRRAGPACPASRVQTLPAPRRADFQPATGSCQTPPHYLVHPVLLGADRACSIRATCSNHDPSNLIGNGRPWKDASDRQLVSLMVLRADLDGFGSLMQRGLDLAVRDALRRAIEHHAADCLHASFGEGDSLMLVDDRILTLIKAVRRIMEEVSEVPGQPAPARRHRVRAGGRARARRRSAGDRGRVGDPGRVANRAAGAPRRDLGDRRGRRDSGDDRYDLSRRAGRRGARPPSCATTARST